MSQLSERNLKEMSMQCPFETDFIGREVSGTQRSISKMKRKKRKKIKENLVFFQVFLDHDQAIEEAKSSSSSGGY